MNNSNNSTAGYDLCAEIAPCFADKHHPVALVLICRHNGEFQHVVVVHLKETNGSTCL